MKNSTVLFVDDQVEILNVLKRMLRKEPYHKLFAQNSKEALQLLAENDVDVIVTDVMMPETNGFELIEMLEEDYPNVVRIVLSGFSHMPTILSAMNHGKIYRYITKPWKIDDDSKKIIEDALEYAKLIKHRQTFESLLKLEPKNFENYLKESVILKDDDIIYACDEKAKSLYLDENFYKPSLITDQVKIFLPVKTYSTDE